LKNGEFFSKAFLTTEYSEKNSLFLILTYSTMSEYELVKNWAPIPILRAQIKVESAQA
jgi:hypothetical protein